MKRLAALLLVPALAAAAPTRFAELTVAGYDGESALADFPALVRVSTAAIEGFAYSQCAADGADLAFEDADGTPLAREIDTWDPDGESLVWVRVPSLSAGTRLAMTWGDASVAAQPASQTNGSVWAGAGYVGVWHMAEASGAVADATGHGLAATPHGGSAGGAVAGAVGKARRTSTSTARGSGYLSVPDYDSFALGSSFTVSGWVRLTAMENWPRLFSRKNLYTDDNGWEIEMEQSYASFAARGRGNDSLVKGSLPSTQDGWVHVALAYGGATLRVYANGALAGVGSVAEPTDNGLPLSIGCDSDGTEACIAGMFDECRLLAGAASADWVAASYAAQSSPGFLGYGPAQWRASDSVLRIVGSPAAVGSPTPGYGAATGLAPNDVVDASVAETTVAADGTARYVLAGWTLDAIDLATGARTRLRASSDPGESPDRCRYVHAGAAELAWLWERRDVLGVAAPALVADGGNSLALSVAVTGLGYDAAPAALKIASGPSPGALDRTNEVAAAVAAPGAFAVSIDRLRPGEICFVRAILESSAGGARAESPIAAFTPTVSEAGGLPGLWQAYFPSANHDWTRDVLALPAGSDWLSGGYRRRELLPLAAYLGGAPGPTAARFASTVWDDEVWWPGNGGQFAYAGYVFLDAAETYRFRTWIDDCELVAVTDAGTGARTVLVDDSSDGNQRQTSASYRPSETGWHAIELRFSDNTGNAGGYGTADGYRNSENLGISRDDGATWTLLADPGDGSVLRTAPPNPIRAEEVLSPGGALASVALSFPAASAARTLRVASGAAHGGDDPAGWDALADAAAVPAGATNATFAAPAAWGSDACLVLRFFFEGDDGAEWSNAVFWRDASRPLVSLASADGSGGDRIVVSGSVLSLPGPDCALTVLIGPSPDAISVAWTGLAGSAPAGPGDFALSLDSEPGTDRELAPGSTVFLAVEAASGGRAGRSAIAEVPLFGAPASVSAAGSAAHRTATVECVVHGAFAGRAAEVSLWGGTSADEASMERLCVLAGAAAADETVSGSFAFPGFDTTYFLQVRAVATTAANALPLETRSAVLSVLTQDATDYVWRPADGDWDGAWNDPAHWRASRAADDCLGYPASPKATASFADCTLEHPVRVTLAGSYTIARLVPHGTAASHVVLAGAGPAASRLRTSLATWAEWSGNGRDAPRANTTIELRDLELVRVGDWEVARSYDNANWSGITNLTLRLSGVAATNYAGGASGTAHFAFATPYSRLELLDGTELRATKVALGGTNTVVRVSDSRLRPQGQGLYLPQDGHGAGLTVVIDGPAAQVRVDTGQLGTYNRDDGATFVFRVPAGGYDAPPLLHPSGDPIGRPAIATARGTLRFDVAKDSPAFRQSRKRLENEVLVDAASGFDLDHVHPEIGSVPIYANRPAGVLKYGADGTPLADGADPSAARQILLDLQGIANAETLIIVK